jgi:ribose transport system substrate-binding protein
MTKKVIAVTLCMFLILTLLLSACGGSSGKEKETPIETEQPTKEEPAKEEPSKDEPAKEEPASEAQILSTGPHGEKATPATTLKLTDEEIAKVKEGNYTAAIVLHYAGNDWSTAQVQGLSDTFEKLGIEVVAVTDSQFKAEKQVSDIENVLALQPDIIVSIPVDPVSTAPAYKKASEQGVKIVFMDNCPEGMQAGKDYVSVVSADNYGNGVAAAEIMAKELSGKGKIGVVFHDADFFVTRQRVEAFEKTIKDKYPDIQIVERGGFTDANKAAEVADAMLTKNPNLDGIFAVWDVPAEGVVAAARTAGREDLVITTIDLGDNVAQIIASGGLIKGLGAQLPYDQGVAEATLAAYALLGKQAPDYVAVPALPVTKDNIIDAYQPFVRQLQHQYRPMQ